LVSTTLTVTLTHLHLSIKELIDTRLVFALSAVGTFEAARGQWSSPLNGRSLADASCRSKWRQEHTYPRRTPALCCNPVVASQARSGLNAGSIPIWCQVCYMQHLVELVGY
jgi:hypothetical protein